MNKDSSGAILMSSVIFDKIHAVIEVYRLSTIILIDLKHEALPVRELLRVLLKDLPGGEQGINFV
jgi:hypothetical protein